MAEIPMNMMRRLNLGPIWKVEDDLATRPGAVHAAAGSPERFEIVAEAMDRSHRPPAALRVLPHMMASMVGIRRSLRTVDKNPSQPRVRISESELAELEEYARSFERAAALHVKRRGCRHPPSPSCGARRR